MAFDPALAAIYAPTGRLRVALNFGNPVLIGRDAAGHAQGITPDIAQMLAAELGVPLAPVEFDRAIDVSARAGADVWDVCFLAVDPDRARDIAFTRPYIEIFGHYLLPPGQSAASAAAVVADGLRVGVVAGSAYSLHLARQPGAGRLVIYPTFQAVVAAFDSGRIEAMAGVREAIQAVAAQRPGSRMLSPPFVSIHQAMGVPVARQAMAQDLRQRLDGWIREGRIADILRRHGA